MTTPELERQLCAEIEHTLSLARKIKRKRPSRQNSLAITHLEDAANRAALDAHEKQASEGIED